MPTFEIPDGPTAIEAPRAGAGPAEALAVYSVTNTTSETVEGRLGVRAAGASKDEWFEVDGNRERTFAPGETQTATIRVRFPAGAPEGNYPFRLRVIAVNDPDNDHAEGPVTTAELGPNAGGKKSLLWLWILLGVLALAVIGGGLYWWLNQEEPAPRVANAAPPPPSPPPSAPAALDTARTIELAEKKAGAWIAAYSERNLDALVALSDSPFYFDGGLLFSLSQIKEKYAHLLAEKERRSQEAQILKIIRLESSTIADLKKREGSISRVADALRLKDDDIGVIVFTESDATILYFRRSPTDVHFAGFGD